jgi:hypothetical protein
MSLVGVVLAIVVGITLAAGLTWLVVAVAAGHVRRTARTGEARARRRRHGV